MLVRRWKFVLMHNLFFELVFDRSADVGHFPNIDQMNRFHQFGQMEIDAEHIAFHPASHKLSLAIAYSNMSFSSRFHSASVRYLKNRLKTT